MNENKLSYKYLVHIIILGYFSSFLLLNYDCVNCEVHMIKKKNW